MNQNKLVIFSFIIFALLFSCKSSKVSIAEAYNTPEEFITTLQKNESIGINPLIFYKESPQNCKASFIFVPLVFTNF